MGDARTVTALQILTHTLYELRDPNGTNYNKDGAYAELLGYLNRCLEYIYFILVDRESELVLTGSGTFSTVAGTHSYALASSSMDDFWTPYRVWISGYEPMTQCTEEDLYDAINAAEMSATGGRARPDEYCIVGGYIWFRDIPDAVYTVKLKYFPNFVPLSATSSTMPYRNLFNNEVIEGIKLFAKHRNEMPVQVEATLKDIFLKRALWVTGKRVNEPVKMTLRV